MTYATSLDKDWSPSAWNRRGLSPDDVILDHVTVMQQGSAKARDSLFFHSSVVQYGTTEKHTLDLYASSQTIASEAPMIVYIHGGYWQFLSKNESAFCAPLLCADPAGAVFIAAEYVLASETQFGDKATMTGICEAMGDLLRAVLQLALKLSCSGIHFVGHSAGAHLLATMLSLDYTSDLRNESFDLIKGIWLVSGVYDLAPISRTYVNAPLHLTKEEIEKYSPIRHVDRILANLSSAPDAVVHIVYGEFDPPVFQDDSLRFSEALQAEKRKQSAIEPDFAWLPEPVKVVGRDHFNVIDDVQNNYILQGLLKAISKEKEMPRSKKNHAETDDKSQDVIF